jgi:hypothetical protein
MQMATCCASKPLTKEEEAKKELEAADDDNTVSWIIIAAIGCMVVMWIALSIHKKNCLDAGYVLAKDEYNHGARFSNIEIAQAFAVAGMKRQDPVYRRRVERGIHTDCDYDCHLTELMEVYKEYRKMMETEEEEW